MPEISQDSIPLDSPILRVGWAQKICRPREHDSAQTERGARTDNEHEKARLVPLSPSRPLLTDPMTLGLSVSSDFTETTYDTDEQPDRASLLPCHAPSPVILSSRSCSSSLRSASLPPPRALSRLSAAATFGRRRPAETDGGAADAPCAGVLVRRARLRSLFRASPPGTPTPASRRERGRQEGLRHTTRPSLSVGDDRYRPPTNDTGWFRKRHSCLAVLRDSYEKLIKVYTSEKFLVREDSDLREKLCSN